MATIQTLVTDDAYVREDLKNDNTGSNITLSVQWYQPFLATNHGLFQATLPSAPSGVVDGDITYIRLYVYSNGGTGNITDMNAYQNNASFSQATVTWNTAPTYSGTITDSIDSNTITAGWRYWELRGPAATNSLTGLTWGGLASFRIRFATQSGATKNSSFTTSNDSSNKPYFEIGYNPPPFKNYPLMHMMQMAGGIV